MNDPDASWRRCDQCGFEYVLRRGRWAAALESNRTTMQEMLAAQESKFAECADAARRRTASLLEAEVSRNDAARLVVELMDG